MNWYIEALKKYAVFSGRARRREYWMFFLVNMIIAIILGIIEGVIDSSPESNRSVLSTLYGLGIFLPSLAVGVRRLHDTGRSGWWTLVGVIPIIGAIVLLIFMAQDSQSADNEYGPNPKRETAYRGHLANQP